MSHKIRFEFIGGKESINNSKNVEIHQNISKKKVSRKYGYPDEVKNFLNIKKEDHGNNYKMLGIGISILAASKILNLF